MLWTTLVAVLAIAFLFDFTNGFHDTANSIATAVSTRALSPRVAVIWAATLQLRRSLYLLQGCSDDRQGHPQSTSLRGRIRAKDHPRRIDRGDRLEPDHLVSRSAVELEPRSDRRNARLRHLGLRPARQRSQSRHLEGDLRKGARAVTDRAAARDSVRDARDVRHLVDHPQTAT